MSHFTTAFLLAVTLLVISTGGCSSKPQPTPDLSVPLAQVAPDLVSIAQKKLPNVKFDSARRKTINGQEVFEIRGKQPNGKIREVEVTADGQIVEVE